MSKSTKTNDFTTTLAKIEEAKTRGPIALLEVIFQNLENCDCLSSTTYEMDIADYCIAIAKLHCLDVDFGFMLSIDTLANFEESHPRASAKVMIESADINQVTCVVTITNKHEEEVAVYGFNFRRKTPAELIRTDVDSWMFAIPNDCNNIQPARDLHLKGIRMISRGVGVNNTLSRKELKQRCKIGDRMAYDALDILSELELKDKQTVIPGVWLISAKKIQKAISLIHELRTEYKVKAPLDSKLDTLVTESVGDVLLSFFDDDYHPGMIGFDFTYNKDVVNLASIRELLPNPIVTTKPLTVKFKCDEHSDLDDLELHTSLYSAINKSLNLPASPIPPFTFRSVVSELPKTFMAGVSFIQPPMWDSESQSRNKHVHPALQMLDQMKISVKRPPLLEKEKARMNKEHQAALAARLPLNEIFLERVAQLHHCYLSTDGSNIYSSSISDFEFLLNLMQNDFNIKVGKSRQLSNRIDLPSDDRNINFAVIRKTPQKVVLAIAPSYLGPTIKTGLQHNERHKHPRLGEVCHITITHQNPTTTLVGLKSETMSSVIGNFNRIRTAYTSVYDGILTRAKRDPKFAQLVADYFKTSCGGLVNPPSPLMLVEQVIDAFPRMYYYQDELDDCRKTYSMSGEVAAEFMCTLKSYFIHYGYIASVSLFDEIEKMSPSDTLTLQPRLATDSALSIMTFRGNINTLSNPVMHTVAIAGETFSPPIVPLMQWLNFIGTAKCKKLNCITWNISGLRLNAIHASLHDLNRANDYFLELEHNLSIATRENESLIWTVEVHKYNATTVNFIFRSGEFNATAVLTAGSVKGTAKTEYQPLVDKMPAKPQPTKVAENIIEPKTDTSWDLDVSPKSMFLDAVALFPEFKPCNAVPHVFKVEYNEELMNHFIDTLSRVCNLRNWVVDDIRHHHPISGNATVTTTVLRNGTLMIVFANVSGLIRVLILTDKTDK